MVLGLKGLNMGHYVVGMFFYRGSKFVHYEYKLAASYNNGESNESDRQNNLSSAEVAYAVTVCA